MKSEKAVEVRNMYIRTISLIREYKKHVETKADRSIVDVSYVCGIGTTFEVLGDEIAGDDADARAMMSLYKSMLEAMVKEYSEEVKAWRKEAK